MKKTNLLLAVILLSVIATFPFLSKELTGKNISITISDNVKELNLKAKYPKDVSQKVHDLVDSQLNLQGDIDLKAIDVEHYVTPDKMMNFSIESEDGYLEIEMKKNENSVEARKKLKELSEALKSVLAGK